MRRGEIWTAAAGSGYVGKPRPVAIVQDDGAPLEARRAPLTFFLPGEVGSQPTLTAVAAPAVKGFTHVSLSVSDLDASLRFYRDVLGLPALAEPYDGAVFDGREAMVLAGRSALGLQCHRANGGAAFDPHQSGLDHIALAIGSRDELHAFAT